MKFEFVAFTNKELKSLKRHREFKQEIIRELCKSMSISNEWFENYKEWWEK